MTLPDSLTERSFTAPDGRQAWRREAIPEILDFMSSNQLAAGRLEVWKVLRWKFDDLTVSKNLEQTWDLGFTFEWAPSHIFDEDVENWEDYARQTCEQARVYFQSIDPESIIMEQFRDTLWYHVEILSQKDCSE